MTDREYQQMLDELAKLTPEELEQRRQFLDAWMELDILGQEILKFKGEFKE